MGGSVFRCPREHRARAIFVRRRSRGLALDAEMLPLCPQGLREESRKPDGELDGPLNAPRGKSCLRREKRSEEFLSRRGRTARNVELNLWMPSINGVEKCRRVRSRIARLLSAIVLQRANLLRICTHFCVGG